MDGWMKCMGGGWVPYVDGWMKKWVHTDDGWMDEKVGT
jgi:hypothetical protein